MPQKKEDINFDNLIMAEPEIMRGRVNPPNGLEKIDVDKPKAWMIRFDRSSFNSRSP